MSARAVTPEQLDNARGWLRRRLAFGGVHPDYRLLAEYASDLSAALFAEREETAKLRLALMAAGRVIEEVMPKRVP